MSRQDQIVLFFLVCVLFIGVYFWLGSQPLEKDHENIHGKDSDPVTIPLFFHFVNNTTIPPSFRSETLPEIENIWSQTGTQFVCLKIDRVEISSSLLALLFDERKSNDFQMHM